MVSTNKKRLALLWPLLLVMVLLLLNPRLVYGASIRGLTLWWSTIAPALLPFFIISELLLELGIATLLAPPLSRLMRPLFYLPGAAALPVLMGFCSGFPTGAVITDRLRREGAVNAEQGARLIAFTNNAGPLYITVSVAVGLLSCPAAGWLLALVHYGGNLLLGMALGLLARLRGVAVEAGRDVWAGLEPESAGSFSLGRALRSAARNSANNILLIGCYMVFFSVLTALLDAPLQTLNPLLHALSQGFWEMSLGMDLLAESGLSLTRILPAAAAILALGGVSVQTQVLAMIADTDISPKTYLLCRGVHTLFSYLATKLLCQVIILPAAAFGSLIPPVRPLLPLACKLCAAALAAWLILAVVCQLRNRRRGRK